MKQWIIISLMLLLMIANPVLAQQPEHAVGIRGGLSSGFTYQYFYQDMNDLKLLLSFRDRGMQLTGLLEKYEPVMINYQDQLFLYYGAGVHAGFIQPDYDKYRFSERYTPSGKIVAGVNGIVGLEYRIEYVPFTFGLDYKPFMELFGERFFRLRLFDFAFSVKYQF